MFLKKVENIFSTRKNENFPIRFFVPVRYMLGGPKNTENSPITQNGPKRGGLESPNPSQMAERPTFTMSSSYAVGHRSNSELVEK